MNVEFSRVTFPLDKPLTKEELEVLYAMDKVGKEPRKFVVELISLMQVAEIPDTLKLVMVFPEYVQAYQCWEKGNLSERAAHQGLYGDQQPEVVDQNLCYGEGVCAYYGADVEGVCWNCGRKRDVDT